MANYGGQYGRRPRHFGGSNWGGGYGANWGIGHEGPRDEDYDTDYGYRGGIGLGSRWANRGGNPAWSGGGPMHTTDRYYGRAPMRGRGMESGYERGPGGFGGHFRDYDAPYRSGSFGSGQGYDAEYGEDFGDRMRRGWNRLKHRAREAFGGDEYDRDFQRDYERHRRGYQGGAHPGGGYGRDW